MLSFRSCHLISDCKKYRPFLRPVHLLLLLAWAAQEGRSTAGVDNSSPLYQHQRGFPTKTEPVLQLFTTLRWPPLFREGHRFSLEAFGGIWWAPATREVRLRRTRIIFTSPREKLPLVVLLNVLNLAVWLTSRRNLPSSL